MSNNMCGMASIPVITQTPTTKNAAAMQYANSIKRMANNDTVAIGEMVKGFLTATESFNLPQMHDKLSRFAVQHEKQVRSILRDLDHYVEMDNSSPQKAILANFIQRLTDRKKEAMDAIINELVYGLVSSDIITLCQPGANEMTIEAHHQQTGHCEPSFHSRQSVKSECCCGKDVSSSQMSKANPISPTAYHMANKDMNHLVCLLSGLITSIIIDKQRPDDASLLDYETGLRCSLQRDLDAAKETDIERKLSSEKQLYWIYINLKQILGYIDIWQGIFDGNREEG